MVPSFAGEARTECRQEVGVAVDERVISVSKEPVLESMDIIWWIIGRRSSSAMRRRRFSLFALAAAAIAIPAASFGQTVPTMPVPGGTFGIGRMGYDWMDQSRREVAAGDEK